MMSAAEYKEWLGDMWSVLYEQAGYLASAVNHPDTHDYALNENQKRAVYSLQTVFDQAMSMIDTAMKNSQE